MKPDQAARIARRGRQRAVGAGGLGSFALTYGFRRWDFLTMWIAIGIIIVLVQLAQFLGNRLARRILRR